MIHLGTVRPGRTIYIPFETFAGATGAPVTMTGFAVGDIKVYKDGSTTERASTSGYTLLDTDGTDFDTITGIHGFSIDLADNTTADFWQAGGRYFVVVSTVTVDSQTVSFVAAAFTIGYDAAVLNTFIATLASQTSFTLNVGPSEDSALVGHWVALHDAASAVQYSWAIVSAYTGSTKTVTLAAAPTFTIAAKDNISFMGIAPLRPTTPGRTLDVTTTGGAGIDWGNVENPTSSVDLQNTIVDSVNTTANVALVGANAINAASIATNAIDDDALSADAVTAFQSGLATQVSVNTIDDFLDTEVAAIKAKTDNLPADPADASDIAAAFTSLNTKVDTIDDFLDTEIAAIIATIGAAGAGLTALPTSAQIVTTLLATVLTQADVSADTTLTVAKALLAAWVQAAGDWTLSSTTLTLKNPDGTTFRTFTLDSAVTPTSRT